MKRSARAKAAGRRHPRRVRPQPFDLPLEKSVGYQVRMTHRALQRYLQVKIGPHGVTLGMWYFLRILWREDGLTQRELSYRIGTREPTTLIAILADAAPGARGPRARPDGSPQADRVAHGGGTTP